MCTPISPGDHRAINTPCSPRDFAQVLEIPVSDIADQHAYLSIDAVEPDVEPCVPAGARIRQHGTLNDAVPWLVVTLYDYPQRDGPS